MWNQKGSTNIIINSNKNSKNYRSKNGGGGERKVGVAIEENKGSKGALKWALDNILTRSQTVRLIHVNNHTTHPSSLLSNGETTPRNEPLDGATDVLLPFRCFCSRREVLWEAVTLEEQDIAKALIDYVYFNRIDTLVLSAPARSNISRLFKTDIPSMVLKGAPSFCNVYIIAKGKVASFRAASRSIRTTTRTSERKRSPRIVRFHDDLNSSDRASNVRAQDEWSVVENDQSSYLTQERMSTESSILSFYNNLGSELEPPSSRSSSVGSHNLDPLVFKSKYSDIDAPIELVSSLDKEKRVLPFSMPNNEELEEKMRMLELQTKQTMDMYHAACKEALTAKQKAREFQLLKIEYEKRLIESEKAKRDAFATIEEEKEKCKVAYKLAKAAYRRTEKEKQKRLQAEMKASEQAEHNKLMLESVNQSHGRLLRHQSLVHVVLVFFLFYAYIFLYF